MSIEISHSHHIYEKPDVEKVKSIQTHKTEDRQSPVSMQEAMPMKKDEYLKGEKADKTPIGLYYMDRDEDGKPKIIFDDPEKANHSDRGEMPRPNPGNPGRKAEECTTNTDKVDREIEKLKEKKTQLEKQLAAASGDGIKAEELTKKITAIEMELCQKDNDSYRRQHAVVS